MERNGISAQNIRRYLRCPIFKGRQKLDRRTCDMRFHLCFYYRKIFLLGSSTRKAFGQNLFGLFHAGTILRRLCCGRGTFAIARFARFGSLSVMPSRMRRISSAFRGFLRGGGSKMRMGCFGATGLSILIFGLRFGFFTLRTASRSRIVRGGRVVQVE